MLLLISPAKTLDFSNHNHGNNDASTPLFQKEALELVQILKNCSSQDLASLMNLSDKLSELNYQRFQNFDNLAKKPAIYAYKGDVYQGLELEQYSAENINFANNYLRIISGLYGILKPLDLIQPYRLEMSIKLINPMGGNLYSFWEEKITHLLNQENVDVIINLASNEYSSSIIKRKLNKPMIDIVFKENNNGTYKIIGIHAKKARGIMANYIIRNSIKTAQEIKEFGSNNYKFMPLMSSENEYVFAR